MATLERTPAPFSLQPEAPKGDQPGGLGVAVQLEWLWARLRRAWLRRFHRDYVRSMAEKRQGECPGCPHDIIDRRDLKFVRSVCGFHFGPEQDPYRPGTLPLARAGLAEVLVSGILLGGLTVLFTVLAWTIHLAFLIGSATAAGIWIFIVSFFRDPNRHPPADADALVSPADGTIISVDEVEDADFPEGRAFRIAIFLSPFNVHVNRVPRSGTVVGQRYFRGAFAPATRGDCDRINEQFWLDLREPSGRLVRIKQVSGAVARRIVCWARSGEALRVGERYGMIKLGSRTDVLIPCGDALQVLVKAGDPVRGAKTVLARLRS